jgi:hypothetical protein
LAREPSPEVELLAVLAVGMDVYLVRGFGSEEMHGVASIGGASVNYLFIEHFQETAQGHFTVRRLERAYGKDIVRAEYERLVQNP